MAPLRDYVYISRRKLEQFRIQRPRRLLEEVALSLKLSVKLLEVSLTKNPTDENMEDMRRVFSKYVEQHHEVGTIDEPKALFGGVLSMKWAASEDVRPPVVYFLGSTDGTAVALAGRLQHSAYRDEFQVQFDKPMYMNEADVVQEVAKAAQLRNEAPALPLLRGWDQSVRLLTFPPSSSAEELEFVAEKHHISEPRQDVSGRVRAALLGSPVYVARLLTS